jgi:hypothetical protein
MNSWRENIPPRWLFQPETALIFACWAYMSARPGQKARIAAKITSGRYLWNDTGHRPLSPEIPQTMADPMQAHPVDRSLPVDRALRIYGVLANRTETRGMREKLSRHLMQKFIEGEKDQHRLTVNGLSYLQQLDRERDSQG